MINYVNFLELEDKSFEKYIIKKMENRELNIFLSKVEKAKVKAIYKEYKSSKNTNEYLNIILTKEGCRDLGIQLVIQKNKMNIPSIKSLYREAYKKGYISKKKYILFVLWQNKFKIFIGTLILALVIVGGYFLAKLLMQLLNKK